MARITSAGAAVYFDTGPNGAAITASAITKAKPAVMTVGDADIAKFEAGGLVQITGSGFASLDGQAFFVQSVDAQAKTVTLRGTDTTAETGTASATTAVQLRKMQEVCFASITTQSPPASDIDVTTICDQQKRTLAGLPQPGSVSFEGFYDATDAGLAAFRQLFESGTETQAVIRFKDHSEIHMPIIVDSLSESIGVDQAVTFSATGKITGKRTYVAPPAPVAPGTNP